MISARTKTELALLKAIEQRGLVSLLNNTKWKYLIEKIEADLPFSPAFQEKLVLEKDAYPQEFDKNPSYLCNWRELPEYKFIEWLKVAPRLAHHKGNLIDPEIEDISEDFRRILTDGNISFEEVDQSFIIYGYK